MSKIVIIIMLFLSPLALARDSARVILLRGSASFGGLPLSGKSKMEGKGQLVVGDKSYLKIRLEDSKTIIALAANTTSEINLALPAEKQELKLLNGIARWVTGEKKGLGVRTPNAFMGIRGTDIYVSYYSKSNESELMCFSGTVVMQNTQNPTDEKTVTQNQWGGIGGQYGSAVTDIKTLPPEVISKFDQVIPK